MLALGLQLSKNLFSGRLLLRPGPGLTNDAQIEAMESFHQVSQGQYGE